MKNSKLKLDAFLSDALGIKQANSVLGGVGINIIEQPPIGVPKVIISGGTVGLIPRDPATIVLLDLNP